MSEKTRKIVIFAAMIATLVWAYFTFAGGGSGSHDRSRGSGQTARADTAATLSPVSDPITDSLFEAFDTRSWGRDPFYHGYRREPPPLLSRAVEFHLLGILFRELDARALINGRIVGVGDTLGAYRVSAITRDEVTLENGETTVTLRVAKESS